MKLLCLVALISAGLSCAAAAQLALQEDRGGTDDGLSCDPYALDREHQCAFVRDTSDCEKLLAGGGFVNYGRLYFCDMSELRPLALAIMIVEILFLFVCLGEVAETFFSPIMGQIADSLGLSQNVAGVTFLALANTAPDLFSGFAAMTSGKVDLGISSLLGAAVFIPLFVFGAVCISGNGEKIAWSNFVRDCAFLLCAAWTLFAFLIVGHIPLWGSLVIGG
eukprot:686823_1